MAGERPLEERFLVLAPTGRDGPLTCSLLERADMIALNCANIEELRREAERGVGAIMVAEEVLTPSAEQRLLELLALQEAWSDLPILVFGGARTQTRAYAERLMQLGNFTLLDRPLRPFTMITAAKAALRARRRQYDAREEMARQKSAVRQRDQFLAMLGHELRNPLGAILLAADMLQENHGTPKHAEIVHRQARHLARLVDDLLDVARITSGKLALQREPVELNDLLERCVAQLQRSARNPTHELQVEHNHRPLFVLGDPVRLEQVFSNLLTNARKYTPTRGTITVGLEEKGDAAVVHVRDTGVGMTAEMLPRVFDLFTQAEETLDRAQGGLGIGLTLVRNLVELHGGSVSAYSEGLGKGSEFVVRLPLVANVVAEARAGAHKKDAERASLRVLVVEDNNDTRELLTTLLQKFGHSVESARDGVEAIETARSFRPDVLLIDIGIPRLDGYAVARSVREMLGRSAILVAVTGYGQPEDKRRALDAGFDFHLTKPVDPKHLRAVLSIPEPMPAPAEQSG